MRFFFRFLLLFQKNTFGIWNSLEEIRIRLIKQAVEDNAKAVAQLTIAYISTAFPFLPKWMYSKLYWATVVECFALIVHHFGPTKKIPLLSNPTDALKDNIVSWDYPGRNFYYLTHVLAKTYGWSLEYIYRLNVDDAMALLQEAFTDEHLNKEFIYGLSEVAYSYNASSKSSKLVPLPRPYWMRQKVAPIKIVKIKKDLLPQGISNADQMEELLRRIKEHNSKVSTF